MNRLNNNTSSKHLPSLPIAPLIDFLNPLDCNLAMSNVPEGSSEANNRRPKDTILKKSEVSIERGLI